MRTSALMEASKMSSKYTYRSNISSAKSNINGYERDISTLDSKLRELERNKNSVESDIYHVESKLESQNRVIRNVWGKIEEVDQEINKRNSDIESNRQLMEERIARTADEVQKKYLTGKDQMQGIDIGSSISAEKIENAVFGEWIENQARVAGLQKSISEEVAKQKVLQGELSELSGYLGSSQGKKGINSIIADLTKELDNRSKVPEDVFGRFLADFSLRCNQIRNELFVEGKSHTAGNNGLFINDYYSIPDIQSLKNSLIESGLETTLVDTYLSTPEIQRQGILTDPELIRLEFSILSRGIDPRAARVMVLYAITRDWENANKSDFNFMEYMDAKFYRGAQDYVNDIRSSESDMAKMVRKLVADGAVDEKGIILENASGIDKIIYSQVDEAVQKYRHYQKKLDERSDTIDSLEQVKSDIAELYKTLEQKMADTRETISSELASELKKPIGKLAGVISLAEAVRYAAELEETIAKKTQYKQESAISEKQLEQTLFMENSATGSTDFIHAEATLERYIGDLIRRYDGLPESEKALKPDILLMIQAADAYLDQRKENISSLYSEIAGYQGTRKGIQSELNSEQQVASRYENEINAIKNTQLAQVLSLISQTKSEISQRHFKISSLQSDISSWESAIDRIEYQERQDSYSHSSSSYSSGGSSFSSFSSGGSSFSGGR